MLIPPLAPSRAQPGRHRSFNELEDFLVFTWDVEAALPSCLGGSQRFYVEDHKRCILGLAISQPSDAKTVVGILKVQDGPMDTTVVSSLWET